MVGKVISVDREAKRAKIEHETIEGFMEAMTMDFPIREDWIWNDLKPGAEIRAELVMDAQAEDPYWLENIGIIAAPLPGQEADLEEKFPQIGQQMPAFRLTNQDGQPVTLSTFKGKTLALTFIYARCPLPEYCIKMSANFSDLAHLIAKDAELKDKVKLLSISFDPENDIPEKLRSYGIGYLGNDPNTKFDIWQLAVGEDSEVRKLADFFDLKYEVDENDRTLINHSLRTAVISPEGKVTKIFSGGNWTPDDLLKAIRETIK